MQITTTGVVGIPLSSGSGTTQHSQFTFGDTKGFARCGCVLNDPMLVGRTPTLASEVDSAHTSIMTVKNAVFMAMIGTLLLTILLAADFIKTVSGVLNDVVPAMALLRSLVYLLASISVTVFFYVFNREQSR